MKARKSKQTETADLPKRQGLKLVTVIPHPDMKVAGAGMAMEFSFPFFYDYPSVLDNFVKRTQGYLFNKIRPINENEAQQIRKAMEADKDFKGIFYDINCWESKL